MDVGRSSLAVPGFSVVRPAHVSKYCSAPSVLYVYDWVLLPVHVSDVAVIEPS